MTRPGEADAVIAGTAALIDYWHMDADRIDEQTRDDAARVVAAAYPIIARAVADESAAMLELTAARAVDGTPGRRSRRGGKWASTEFVRGFAAAAVMVRCYGRQS